MGLYRGGPASDCIPVHRKSQIYTDPSRDEVVRISFVNTQLRWGGDTCIVGFKHYFLERCFVIIGEHGNTFPTHNIEYLPRLITRRSSLPLVSRVRRVGTSFMSSALQSISKIALSWHWRRICSVVNAVSKYGDVSSRRTPPFSSETAVSELATVNIVTERAGLLLQHWTAKGKVPTLGADWTLCISIGREK